MNVLIIGDFCYPNYMGGSSKHVYDILTEFSKIDSLDVHLITRAKQEGNYSANEIDAQITFDRIKNCGQITELKGWHMFNPLHYLKHIKNADVVLLQHPIMGFVGALIAKLYYKRTIYHYHGPIHEEYKLKAGKKGIRYRLLWIMQKVTVLLSSKVLTHSNYMRGIAIKEHRLPDRKSIYLPPYIEEDPVNNHLDFVKNNNKTKLIIPRRLTARTGVVEFLNAFLSLPKEKRNQYDIYISGKGELQQEVENLVRKDADNLSYVGFLSYEDLWSMYHKMDAVVVPTLNLEGFGYIILEALSSGATAIVSETCGGGYEFVVEHLGKENTFDVFSSESIFKALEQVEKTKNNRRNNKQIAGKFSCKAMIDYYIKAILNVN